MKNIIFLLSILLGQPLFCQAQRLGDFLANMVAPLDKTEITSNFLWDKGLNGFAEPVTAFSETQFASNPQPSASCTLRREKLLSAQG